MSMKEVEQLSILYNFLYELTMPLSCFMEDVLKNKYKTDWWKKGVLAKLDEEDRKEIIKKDIKSLNLIDLQKLLKLLSTNISIFDEQINRKEIESKNNLLNISNTVKNIRNKVAHPVQNKMNIEIFKLYIKYLYSFGVAINVNNESLINLVNTKVRYVVSINDNINNEENVTFDKIKIDEMFITINTIVLIPALKCKTLDEDIKDSVLDTRDRLKIKKTSREIYEFFKDALISKRGKMVYKELKKNGLKGFEDIINDIEKIYFNENIKQTRTSHNKR